MSKLSKTTKYSFITFVLLIFYIPLLYMLVFSFNDPSIKGFLSFNSWNGATGSAYKALFSSNMLIAFANSTVIALATVLIIISLSLITCFGLWRQKNKAYKAMIDTTNNIPIINPDIITAIGLAIVFTMLFGSLAPSSEGLWRGITSHVVMEFPYAFLIMYPQSEKFNESLLKASYDLGYGKIRSWFKTYVRHMLVPILFSTVVATIFSFDDFILVRITSNVQTIGIKLFVGQFQPWALALGSLLLIIVLLSNIIFITWKIVQNKRNKVTKKILNEDNLTEELNLSSSHKLERKKLFNFRKK